MVRNIRSYLQAVMVVFVLGFLPVSHAAIADSPAEVQPVLIGHAVDDINLRDDQGEPVSLQQVIDGKPAALVFYRGGWCPFCNLQLGQLQGIEADLQEMGVQLIAITPDPPGALRGVTNKHQLKYRLLSDSDMAAGEAFGVAYKLDEKTIARYKKYEIYMSNSAGEARYQLPVPAIFLINGEGVVEFTYVNPDPAIRIDPELLLTAARVMVKD